MGGRVCCANGDNTCWKLVPEINELTCPSREKLTVNGMMKWSLICGVWKQLCRCSEVRGTKARVTKRNDLFSLYIYLLMLNRKKQTYGIPFSSDECSWAWRKSGGESLLLSCRISTIDCWNLTNCSSFILRIAFRKCFPIKNVIFSTCFDSDIGPLEIINWWWSEGVRSDAGDVSHVLIDMNNAPDQEDIWSICRSVSCNNTSSDITSKACANLLVDMSAGSSDEENYPRSKKAIFKPKALG